MQSEKIKQTKKSPELTEKEETEKKKKCESYNIPLFSLGLIFIGGVGKLVTWL